MIKDLFVNKTIKDMYINKPDSIKKFIKLIEKRNNAIISSEIKKALKIIYPDSYTSRFRTLNITGPRGSGKTLLAYIVILYDAYRTIKLKNLKSSKFSVCMFGTNMESQRAKNILNYKLKSFPFVIPIDVFIGDQYSILGRNINVFLTDEPRTEEVVKSKIYDESYYKFLLKNNNVYNSHFITIADTLNEKMSHEDDEHTFLINLSGNNK